MLSSLESPKVCTGGPCPQECHYLSRLTGSDMGYRRQTADHHFAGGLSKLLYFSVLSTVPGN